MRPQEISERIILELQTIYEDGEARSLTKMILEEVFLITTSDVILNREVPDHPGQLKRLELIMERLMSCEPIQYILGYAWFMGEKYIVNNDVLIPRQETEELVDLILKEDTQSDPVILDIGTGTGCIPIALKKKLSSAEVHASEVSGRALEVARENARKIGAEVTFHRSDILKEFPAIADLDIIVSNPPYVQEKEKKDINWNVLDHEPELALFVSDEDPLVFYRVISDWASRMLKSGGRLYFEINEALGKEMELLMVEKNFLQVRLIKDINSKDRFVSGVRP